MAAKAGSALADCRLRIVPTIRDKSGVAIGGYAHNSVSKY